ncbi:MAG TPA: tripartite tricarboxylate transporter substrate binding protein [Ramlibacter sp.]|nr:tripartite tricarboxylate transporter substrate binding protein [Ramlibacter sp.]
MKNARRAALVAALATCAAITMPAQAQTWPAKPVRWIVPFGAGGTADATARLIAQRLSDRWGQQVVVDNKPGANTAIGALDAARAAPDGYTLFQAINSTLTINPHTFAKLPYDPVRDFTSIGLIASVPLIFVANDTLPVKTMQEFIALAKKQPGMLTVGGGSVGMQLAAERFVRDAGAPINYVPYKSGADVTKGLLSGEIQAGVDGVPAYPPLLKAGKLRVLATNSPRRISALPDVPTLGELGLKQSEAPVWHALLAPAGLPPEIQKKIAADLQAVLALPELKERMATLGLEATWAPADELVKLVKSESAYMGPLVKDLGIKMD